VPLFESGTASLAAALKIIASGKERAAGLSAYQTFVVQANDAAKKAGLDLEIKVDSKKQSDPAERETWIEGPSPDIANLAQFTREAVSTLDLCEIVPPSAVILTREEQEHPEKQRPLIKFFLSYAHADRERVEKLRVSLEKDLQLSKRFQFEIWTDRNIEVGADWDADIRKALAECDFGLLFISKDFLVSRYIVEKELPHFVSGQKPVIPVGLTQLDFLRIDMKGLEAKQIYRLPRPKEEPRFFSQCRGEMAEDFVRDLASAIEKRVSTCLEAPASLPSRARSRLPKLDAARVHNSDDDVSD